MRLLNTNENKIKFSKFKNKNNSYQHAWRRATNQRNQNEHNRPTFENVQQRRQRSAMTAAPLY